MWKSLVNLVLATLLLIFQSDLNDLIGRNIIYLAIPITFSFVFFLIYRDSKEKSFTYNLIAFLVLFGLIYFIFNFKQNSFYFINFVLSLIITGFYVYFQNKFFPESHMVKKF